MAEHSKMSAWNMIADILISKNEPLKLETLANQSGYAKTTLSEYAREMKQCEPPLLTESKGLWFVTPELRELHRENPYWGATHFRKTNGTGRVLWLELLNKELITNSCVADAAVYNNWGESLALHSDLIDIFFFLWLVKEGHITEYDFPKEMTPTELDHFILKILNRKDYKENA